MAAPTSRLASRVVALLALCICTDSLHAQWGNIEAEWKLEDASVGWTLTGAKGTAILGSVVVPVQCVGPTDARLYWSVPSNWNDVLVPFRLYEKYSDYVTNPGSVEVWTVDCGEKTVQMFFEDLTPNLGPTETDLTAHIPLHEFGIPAYAGMGIRLKYDVTIDGRRLVFLDQDSVLESLLIGGEATLEIGDAHSLTVRNPILNVGTFRKSSGVGIASVSSPINNTGTVEVQSGTLVLSGSGTSPGRFDVASGAILEFAGGHTLQSGSTLTGPGLVRVNGNVGLENTGVSGNVQVVAGHLGITGAVNVSGRLELTGSLFDSYVGGPGDLRVTGRLDWLGGTMDGEGGSATIAAGAEMRISGDDHKRLRNQTINNAGTVVWTGAGCLFGSSGVFNNQAGGVFEIQSDSTFLWWDRLAYGWPTFNNAGILRKSEGTGTTTFDSVTFNNTGTVEVQSGTLVFQGGYTQTDGATMLTGGTLRSGNALDIQGGDIGGWGTIISDLLNAGGRVLPGTSIGHLIVAGDYTQGKDANLLIELAGTAFGDFDVLDITGHATLGGELDIALIDGFMPSFGYSFAFITFGSRSGEFASVKGLDLGNGLHFDLAYGTQSLTLTTVPEPTTLGLLAAGIGLCIARRLCRTARGRATS